MSQFKLVFCYLSIMFDLAVGVACQAYSEPVSRQSGYICSPYLVLKGKISEFEILDGENVGELCQILEISDSEMKRLMQVGSLLLEESFVNNKKNFVQLIHPYLEDDFKEFINKDVIVHGYLRILITNILTPVTIEVKGIYMKLSDEAIDFLEEQIPELAQLAVKQAYWNALASGFSVLKRENGALVEVFPDGTKTFIKQLPPAMRVVPGQKLTIPKN